MCHFQNKRDAEQSSSKTIKHFIIRDGEGDRFDIQHWERQWPNNVVLKCDLMRLGGFSSVRKVPLCLGHGGSRAGVGT